MFGRSLALAPMLLLVGAAPLQDAQTRAAIECKLPREGMLAAMKRIPVRNVRDNSQAPGRQIITIYESPEGVTAYGFPATFTGSADILSDDDERILLMATIKAPFASVERAVLAAHGRKDCDARLDDGDGEMCGLSFPQQNGWEASIAIKQYPNEVGISCAFSRDPQ